MRGAVLSLSDVSGDVVSEKKVMPGRGTGVLLSSKTSSLWRGDL
jgi:hypothetical protein